MWKISIEKVTDIAMLLYFCMNQMMFMRTVEYTNLVILQSHVGSENFSQMIAHLGDNCLLSTLDRALSYRYYHSWPCTIYQSSGKNRVQSITRFFDKMFIFFSFFSDTLSNFFDNMKCSYFSQLLRPRTVHARLLYAACIFTILLPLIIIGIIITEPRNIEYFLLPNIIGILLCSISWIACIIAIVDVRI